MRLKALQGSASSQQEWQNGENGGSTVRHIHEAGAPLTEEMRHELRVLAETPDSKIDFSDIPELTEEEFRSAVRGGFGQKTAHAVGLKLEGDAAAWLQENAVTRVHAINHVLKQVVQHGRRAARERGEGSTRPIYNQNSQDFMRGLELLSGRVAPPLRYVEVPEYSDDELRSFTGYGWPVLRQQTFTLHVDDEVYEWVRCCAPSYSIRVNYAMRFLAHQVGASAESSSSGAS